MAENKKSFVLYTDLIHTVSKLPNDKAGLLFKHLLSYVNDLNPLTNDEIVDIVFEPIKQQLKRDLKHWESKSIIKAENGILGNLKRWNFDLYERVINKDLDLMEANNIAKSRKVLPANSPKIESKETSNKEVKIPHEFLNNKNQGTLNQYFESLKNGDSKITIAKQLNIDVKMVLEFADKFKNNCELEYLTFAKFAFHFKNWVVKQKENQPTIKKSKALD